MDILEEPRPIPNVTVWQREEKNYLFRDPVRQWIVPTKERAVRELLGGLLVSFTTACVGIVLVGFCQGSGFVLIVGFGFLGFGVVCAFSAATMARRLLVAAGRYQQAYETFHRESLKHLEESAT